MLKLFEAPSLPSLWVLKERTLLMSVHYSALRGRLGRPHCDSTNPLKHMFSNSTQAGFPDKVHDAARIMIRNYVYPPNLLLSLA